MWSEVVGDRSAMALTITDGVYVWESKTIGSSSSSSCGDAAPVFDSSFIAYTAKPASRRESWSSYLAILESAFQNKDTKRFDYRFGRAPYEDGFLSIGIAEILPVVPAQRIQLLHDFRLPRSGLGREEALLRMVSLLGTRNNDLQSELMREAERNDRIRKDNDFLFGELSAYKEAKERTQDDLFRKFALVLNEKRETSNYSSSSSASVEKPLQRAAEAPARAKTAAPLASKPSSSSNTFVAEGDGKTLDAKRAKVEGGNLVIGSTMVQVLSGQDQLDLHLSQNHPAPAPVVASSSTEISTASGFKRKGFFAR